MLSATRATILALALMVALPHPVRGETPAPDMVCSFTEPFLELHWHRDDRRLVTSDFESLSPLADAVQTRLVPAETALAALPQVPWFDATRTDQVLQFLGPDGALLLQVAADGMGSDGMSDRTFPLSAHHAAYGLLIGGCALPDLPARPGEAEDGQPLAVPPAAEIYGAISGEG